MTDLPWEEATMTIVYREANSTATQTHTFSRSQYAEAAIERMQSALNDYEHLYRTYAAEYEEVEGEAPEYNPYADAIEQIKDEMDGFEFSPEEFKGMLLSSASDLARQPIQVPLGRTGGIKFIPPYSIVEVRVEPVRKTEALVVPN